MKTAISLPDPLFQAAEQFAQKNKMSRSELYAHALEFFLASRRADEITARLDQVYADESNTLDPAFVNAQARVLAKDDW